MSDLSEFTIYTKDKIKKLEHENYSLREQLASAQYEIIIKDGQIDLLANVACRGYEQDSDVTKQLASAESKVKPLHLKHFYDFYLNNTGEDVYHWLLDRNHCIGSAD